MFKTPILSILCIVVASILGAVGQFIIKSASDKIKGGVLAFLLDVRIIIGMICYLTVMGLFVYAFKRGGSVTVLYPIYASTFIWAAIIALVLYQQPIKPVHILGMVLLVSGMVLMGL